MTRRFHTGIIQDPDMTTNTFYDSFCRLSESAMKSLIFTLTALTFISASSVSAEDRFGVLRCGPAAEKTDEAGVLEKVERNYGTLSTLAARFLASSKRLSSAEADSG